MNILRVYKEMDITYAELEKAMKALHFKKQVVRSDEKWREEMLGKPVYFLVFKNENENSNFSLPFGEGTTLVPKHYVVSLSDQLNWQGITGGFDDLAKQIENNRLVERQPA